MPKPHEIRRIAAIALSSIDTVLAHWLPGGERKGSEYLTLNPKRADSEPGSFSINLKTGKWADFASDDKGLDPVALVAYLENETQGKAAKRLAAFLGIELEESNQPKRPGSDSRKPANGKSSTSMNESIPAPIPPGLDADRWRCVMPIPDNAPHPPKAHPRHGPPTKRYPYRAQDGRVNFYHDRHDKPDGEKKQFSPLTFWQKVGKSEWRFSAPPEPRPLYGLPELLQFPDAVCWFVEGEKAAEALQKLLPDHPVLCWQGGSQAVSKSDYSPLAGRDCVVFPDNDLPGKKATGDLVKRLTVAGARSVKVLNIDQLERGPGEPLQQGDDAADLVVHGWDARKFAAFLSRVDAYLDYPVADPGSMQSSPADKSNEPQAETVHRGFELFDDGLYFLEPTKDGKLRRRKVCGKLEVLAKTRTEDNKDWGLVCSFRDPDGIRKRVVIPMRDFSGDGLPVASALLSDGLVIMPKARPLLIEYLQTVEVKKRARTTNRTGWHGSGDDLAFVLPDASIGQSDEEWLFSDNRPDQNHFKQRGTLKQWQENVAALCVGNSRLTFSVSIAFAAPLLHLIGMESGGFHFRSSSSDGKTSALFVAGSVCGSSEYLQRWRSTDNGLEGIALSRCDSLLTLDELKMVDARIAAESSYLLANGAAKVRANVNGGARNTAKWRLLFLSSGELSLAQHAAEAGKKVPAGAELRMADIPADAGQGLGCFENLHGFENGKEFSEGMNAIVKKYYGTPFRAFIEQVLTRREGLPGDLSEAMKTFGKTVLTSGAGGQVQRVAARFALVGAAGELATDWGVTGWPPGESIQSAMKCFKDWLAAFGGEGNHEERTMIEQVRHFLELHGEARFTDIDRAIVDDSHAPKTLNKAGFREKNASGELEFYCYPGVFKTEICRGFDYRAVARLLISKGYMRPGEDRNLQVKQRLPGEGAKRVFHVKPSIWSDQND